MKPVVMLLLGAGLVAHTAAVDYRAEVARARADRVAELTAPNGWLAVAGLFWLHEGANSAGSGPSAEVKLPVRAGPKVGTFVLENGLVTFSADPSAVVTADGRTVRTFAFDPQKDEQSAIVTSGVTMFIIKRGNRLGVRLLDPQSDARTHFSGLKYFPLDPAYHVSARFVASAPKKIAIVNVLGMTVPMESPGYVEFTLQGTQYRLDPVYETSKHENLFFLFRDLTSGRQTYGAGRFLHAPLPVNGRVDLDFNRAYNPPCAFTAFATCPLPPRANNLPIRIAAGELKYEGRDAPEGPGQP